VSTSTAISTIELSCSVVTNHPSAEGKGVSWRPTAERVGSDLLVVRNTVPHLGRIGSIAEQHAELFSSSTVVGEDLRDYDSPTQRRSDEYTLGSEGCPEELLFYSLLCCSVEPKIITAYLEHVNPHATVHVGSGFNLLRYREGGFFLPHVDVTRDHPVLGHRRLSTILFCNDDYDGGELYFPRQGITIKPEVGLMVMFPAGFTHPHESTMVTKGTKYSIVSWYL
jgi:hypothetical protein